MHLYQAGETSQAICYDCSDLVPTTFSYRDVPFDDGVGTAKGILASVCDRCGGVVAIPAQSTPAIRRAREQSDVSLEIMLPAPDLELLDLAAFRIDQAATPRLRKVLIAHYIHRAARKEQHGEKARRKAEAVSKLGRAAKGVPRRRLSMKISPRMDEELRSLMAASGREKTEVVRGLIHLIGDEIVHPASPRGLDKLRDIAAVAAA